MQRPRFSAVLFFLTVFILVGAACSDDVADDVGAAVEEAADDAGQIADDAAGDAEDAAEDAVDDAAEAADDAAAEVDERAAELAQVLRDNDLESLASAVEQVDLTELVGDGEFTFFAPNDEAFLELDADQLADLLSDPEQLATVLEAHIVTERVDSTALVGMTSVDTRSGSQPVTVDGDTVMVGDATVVNADIDAGDGVVHVVDTVIMP